MNMQSSRKMGVVNERSGRGLKFLHTLRVHSIDKNLPLIDPGSTPARIRQHWIFGATVLYICSQMDVMLLASQRYIEDNAVLWLLVFINC